MGSRVSNEFTDLLSRKVIDAANDTFKIILMSSGFSYNPTTMDVYADVSGSELATGSGYTAGGATLSGVSISRDDVNNETTISWANPSWTASGGNISAQGAIIYDDTVASPVADPIICWIDFGTLKTTYDGGVFTIANVGIAIVNEA